MAEDKAHRCDECGEEIIKLDDMRGWQGSRVNLSLSTSKPPKGDPRGYQSESQGYEAFKALLCYKCTEKLAAIVRGKRDTWGMP
jgi:hypothetical protein